MYTALVTCGFTTFNAQDTVKRAIFSALNQTYSNLEIVIVDDFSNDSTLDVLKEIEQSSPYPFRIISHKENMGVAVARNSLIKHAKGEFLAFFDDDDYSYPSRILEQLNKLTSFENLNDERSSSSPIAICYSNRQIIYPDSSKLVCTSINLNASSAFKDHIIASFLSADSFPFNARPGSTATCTLFSRTITLKEIGCFNNHLRRFEDLDLAIKALMKGISLISTNSILLDQYITNTPDKSDADNYEFILLDIHKSWLYSKGLYEFAYSYIKFKHSFLNLKIIETFTYGLKLITKYPIRFILKIFSSSRTFAFTILNNLLLRKHTRT